MTKKKESEDPGAEPRPSRFGATGATERLSRLGEPTGSMPGKAATPASPSKSDEANPRLLFILSTERSGSTLLSMALGANARHISPPEMHLLSYPTFAAWRSDYPSAMLSLQFLLRSCGIDETDSAVDQRFADWRSEDVYRWILAERLGRDKIFIDKTPKYARSLDVLERLDSLRPRYIWLVRHPMAVAASQIALRRDRREAKSAGLVDRLKAPLRAFRETANRRRLLRQEVDYWKAVHSNVERFLSNVPAERWRRTSFERLVSEPEAVLREICTWLGTEFRAEMLDPGEHVPREMRPELGDPKIYRRQRIDASAADAWREQYGEDILDDADRALIRHWGVGS
jgi:hypothetical protein